MTNILKFPLKPDSGIDQIMESMRGLYIKGGLASGDVNSAVDETRLHIEKLLMKGEYVMELPADAGLSQAQIDLVADAHNKCIREAIADHHELVRMAILSIVDLVTSKYVY